MKLYAGKATLRETGFRDVGVDGPIVIGPVLDKRHRRFGRQAVIGMRNRAEGNQHAAYDCNYSRHIVFQMRSTSFE